MADAMKDVIDMQKDAIDINAHEYLSETEKQRTLLNVYKAKFEESVNREMNAAFDAKKMAAAKARSNADEMERIADRINGLRGDADEVKRAACVLVRQRASSVLRDALYDVESDARWDKSTAGRAFDNAIGSYNGKLLEWAERANKRARPLSPLEMSSTDRGDESGVQAEAEAVEE